VQCAGSESSDSSSVVWSTCSNAATRTEIGPPAACTCTGTDADAGILTGPKRFSQVASLPPAVGETVSFQPGHTPDLKEGTSRTTVASSTAASDGRPVTTATMTTGPLAGGTTPPTAPDATAAGDKGLSKGSKAGIGVGVAAFCAAALALAAFLFVRYRRRHSNKQPKGETGGYQPAAPGPDMAQSPPPRYGSTPGGPYYDPSSPPPPQHQHDVAASGYYPGGYTGFKSELPAVPVESSKSSHRLSELPAGGDGVVSSAQGGRGLDRNATPSLISMPGSPGHLSMVSDLSRAPSVAPSMQSSQGDLYGRSHAAGNMAPIAELYG
jgi:hypothetical protein